MKSLRALLAALFGASAAVAEQPKTPSKAPAEMMRELRLQWLTKKPPTASEEKKEEIAAVVMDWPLDEAIVTVLASSGGDASIYTTGSFGILGGIGHESVRKAAVAFVECARKHRALAAATTDYSYPNRETVRFFFVTAEGVQSVSFSQSQVEKTDTEPHDLYSHGQAVLTELRQVTQKRRGY
jgi:hypothetical protein